MSTKHMKLNHTNKKSTKTDKFGFTGFNIIPPASPAPLPSITTYNKIKSHLIPDKFPQINLPKTDSPYQDQSKPEY